MTVTVAAQLPGLRVVADRPAAGPDPLRTDVAAFLGGFPRGPVGVAARVTSWTEAQQAFGPIDGRRRTPYAVSGFFANGGRTAWLIRIGGAGAATARAVWTVGEVRGRGGFRHAAYGIEATSPGEWANQTRVTIRFRASSVAGPPSLTVRVAAPGEPVETFAEVRPGALTDRLASSRLIRVTPLGEELPAGEEGPLTAFWTVVLGATGETRGADPVPGPADYRAAFQIQADEPEPALLALPELGADLPDPADRAGLVRDLLAVIAPMRDRLVVLDTLTEDPAADAVLASIEELAADGELLRAAALYHPAVRVPDPPRPLATVPACGHVLGLIARLDTERGPHQTPANAALLEVADLAVDYPVEQQARMFAAGVNLLRALPGRGPLVWGGRTLDNRFVAHRRLVHLLVRAIRRVADPLVFEVNGPELRFTLVRGITSVLLAAFRSGALAGERPEEAFSVTCDERNNPPGSDPATVVCDIDVTPADPMEFITLRLVLGQDRALEVVEQ
jgi:hypothetical protein